MNLHGLRVLNTRPRDQARALSNAIQHAGGFAIDIPALAINAMPTIWLQRLPPLTDVDQALFLSPNAVDFFYQALSQAHLTWPVSIRITAIGQGTADKLNDYQRTPPVIPPIADSEHLLLLPNLNHIAEQTILLVKGCDGRQIIEPILSARGAIVHVIDVYRRDVPSIHPARIEKLWQNNEVDIIIFTSQEAMRNLFKLYGPEAHTWIRRTPCVVISSRLAIAAKALGIQHVYISQLNTILETLQGFVHDQN